MLDPIRIEQYANVKEDGEDLWEITDLTVGDLSELNEHLSLSPVPLSDDLVELLKELRRVISSLDMRRAG